MMRKILTRNRYARTLLGALFLLILPISNGMPSVFTDTKAYMVLGGYIFEKVGLSRQGGSEVMLAGHTETAITKDESEERYQRALSGAAARSPYYSVYLFSLAKVGGFWFVVVIQALMTALLIDIVTGAVANGSDDAWRLFFCTVAALSLLSTLPLFIAFMMPDLFGGCGVLAVLALVVFYKNLSSGERAFLMSVAAFASLAHTTHLVSMGAAICASTSLLFFRAHERGSRLLLRSALCLVIACIGLGGAFLYETVARAVTKSDIHRPPFLTARILEDGPGINYLKFACAEDPSAYVLCGYIDRDLSDSQVFLWSRTDPAGVFASATSAVRRGIIADEPRFVRNALLFDPVGQLIASAHNVGRLLTSARVDDITDTGMIFRSVDFQDLHGYIFHGDPCLSDHALCNRRIPDGFIAALTAIIGLGALIGMVVLSSVARDNDVGKGSVEPFCFGMVAAILSNAVVCAIISGPYPRYQSKMTWILIVGFAAAAYASRLRRADWIKDLPPTRDRIGMKRFF